MKPNLKYRIKALLKKTLPVAYSNYIIRKIKKAGHEPEIQWIEKLCSKKGITVDIGAACGQYTFLLAQHSKLCYAFEPREKQAKELVFLASHSRTNIKVEQYALSDKEGECEFYITEGAEGLSSLEPTTENSNYTQKKTIVRRKKLDDYRLENVSFIKIDVEGHEQSVIIGASETINRWKPVLMIEIEKRHNAKSYQIILKHLVAMGYDGFFLIENKWKKIKHFDQATHQSNDNTPIQASNWKPRGVYINNFVFIHKDTSLPSIVNSANND